MEKDIHKRDIVTFNTNKVKRGKDSLEILEAFSEKNEIPIFKGEVKHGYESDFLGYKDKCPKCQAPTEQLMSNFAYATQEAARLSTAPAGHFCTECPTVIIDDDLMRAVIDSNRFWYGGVFSIETGYTDEPHYFETFNGEKPLIILDEDMQNVCGLAQSVQQKDFPSGLIEDLSAPIKKLAQRKKKTKIRKKNRAAKNARKRNRRK